MDFATGFATGWAMGKKMFEGGGGECDIYITNYAESSITVTTVTNRSAATLETKNHIFSFTVKEYKTVTTITSGDTQTTHTWVKKVITSVANIDGKTVWTLKPNDTGKIIAVYDLNGNELLSGSTNGDSIKTATPEGVALGYALAYSKEQDELMERLLDAYKQGMDDQKDIDDETAEVEVIDLNGSGAIYIDDSDGAVPYTVYCNYILVHSDNATVTMVGINKQVWKWPWREEVVIGDGQSSQTLRYGIAGISIYGDIRYEA